MNVMRAIALGLLLTGAARAQVAAPAASAPVEARARGLFEGLERRDPAATVAVGANVVSAADPRAAEAGMEMLRRGGTAADAAVATMVALTVVEPQSSGLGGGAFVLAHGADGLIALDGREQAPASAKPDRFLGPDGKPLPLREAIWGGRSVGVPGMVAVAAELHRRRGKLPWAALFEPAIRLAEGGVVVTPRLARTLETRRDMVAASGAAARFLRPDGATLRAGDRLVQPELAATLRALAAGGPDAFYRGPIGAAVAAAVSDAPRGAMPMTAADLAAYRVVERTPLCRPYRGWRVCTMAPPSAGGVAVLQMLGILEKQDMARLGPDDPLAWHAFAEATRLALADRAAFGADPGYVVVPTDGMLDRAYLDGRAALVRLDARAAVTAGTPPGTRARAVGDAGAEAGTTHLSVADAAGNVVSVTSTIESIFGSGQVAGGFFLNNQLTDFDLNPLRADGSAAPNRVEAGKRPRSSMAPVILYAPDGRVAGAIGAAGGVTIIAQVAKAVVGVIDWRLPVERAIALPQLFADGDRFAYEAAGRFPAMAATWAALGHKPAAADLPLKANGVMRDGRGWRGAADPRSEGQAVGWGNRR